jgi:diguanylate cyclase (GGDEF)-like protein
MGVEDTEPYQYIVPFLVGLLFGGTFSLLIHFYGALKLREEELKEIASTDSLTGLPNRRSVLEYLKFEINRAKRKKVPLSIAILDVDDFKQINDTFGHMVGDRVLKELAILLRKNLRSGDVVGRFGGEEFVVVFPETELITATKIMERIRRVIENTYFEPVGSVSISVGVTEFREGDTLEDLLKRADEKLYQAKREGKNRVVVG